MAIDHTDLTTDEARQGETGHGVRYMLGYGLVLAVIAMGLAAMFAW
jgi:hypothetical protein